MISYKIFNILFPVREFLLYFILTHLFVFFYFLHGREFVCLLLRFKAWKKYCEISMKTFKSEINKITWHSLVFSKNTNLNATSIYCSNSELEFRRTVEIDEFKITVELPWIQMSCFFFISPMECKRLLFSKYF